jgi:hypothetical protein
MLLLLVTLLLMGVDARRVAKERVVLFTYFSASLLQSTPFICVAFALISAAREFFL